MDAETAVKVEDEEMEDVKPEIKVEESTSEENPESLEERKEFKTLGIRDLKHLEKLRVTSSWVSNATTFSAAIDSSTSQNLNKINLPDHLKNAVPESIKTWFPVQFSVLPTIFAEIRQPPAIRPRDIAIAAPTGSGKTLCYVLPVLAACGIKKSNILHAIILVPAQTLASQVVEEFNRWNKEEHNTKVLCLSGATEFEKEARSIATNPPNVIVATPARLVQHLTSKIPSPLDLTKLRFLIVDEADRMGKLMREEWLELVEFLTGGMKRVACMNDVLSQRRAPQKIVLSATLSKDVEELHLWNLFKPKLFSATAKQSEDISGEINHMSGKLALPTSISHRLVTCDAKYHPLAVYQQIRRNQFNRTVIFVNEIKSSDRLAHVLKELCAGEYVVDYFTANLFGKRRFKMLKSFNNNEKRILISSDVLARGTDLNTVDCVINYNLPRDDKLFVHRAGRTGRAGKEGYVISVGDKETKRIFIKMLKVTNLWGDTVEENMEEYLFEKDMEKYTKAIESLKLVVTSQNPGRITQKSGFEAKRRVRPTKNGEKPWLKRKNVEN